MPVIWDIDTRALVRHLRKVGALRGVLATDGTGGEQLIAEARALPTMAGLELAGRVSCDEAYHWNRGSIDLAEGLETIESRQEGPSTAPGLPFDKADAAAHKSSHKRYRVVAYDYGIKQNILRLLVDGHCDVTVVPAKTSAQDVLALNPDGVFLSNGPGDPTDNYAQHSQADGARAGFRDLPGASIMRAGAGRPDVQIEIRPSWQQSSGKEFAHRAGGDYLAEPRLLRGPGFAACVRSRNNPCQPERSNQWRVAAPEVADVQRAITPRGIPRAARCALPLWKVSGLDGRTGCEH